jgi:precorrin-6Y C5,15-methyltransferase (decarboxylating)
MAVIVVFGGTVEGRLFAEAFQNTELELHICVATEYGASLLPECPNIKVHTGRMDKDDMEKLFDKIKPEYCLDATHPYAVAVTENAVHACQKRNVPYIRVAREQGGMEKTEPNCDSKIIYQESVEAAVAFLCKKKGNIFITTGSNELEKYTVIEDYRDRCYARVLPVASVLEKCRKLGFEGKNLIGMQGPFGEELNYWMIKQINAVYLVTKNSGKEGGFEEKCNAALRAGVHVLVIGREREESTDLVHNCKIVTLEEAIQFLQQKFRLEDKREVFLIGMGPGAREQLTVEAVQCLKACDVVIGSKRMLSACRECAEKPSYACYKKEDIAVFLKEHPEYKKAAIVYSGDIGFYSAANGIDSILKDYKVRFVSGISSALYFLNQLSIPWDSVKFASCHGRKEDLLYGIRQNRWLCVLLGNRDSVKTICQTLLEYHMEEVKVTIGERLSYPEQTIICGMPDELCGREVDSLSVILLENPNPRAKKVVPGIGDSAFVRGDVPMTKQEIRILSLAKLRLFEDSIVFDIGAGTGSVAVEAALSCEKGKVYAIEQKKEGVKLIQKNKRRFGADNLIIVEGTAPGCLSCLPKPTHVFIGGSGGNLIEIIRTVKHQNSEVRFVINAVTLETMAQIEQIREEFPEYLGMEVILANVARAKELGRYHLMSAENPVYIASFGGRREHFDGNEYDA